MQDNFTERFQVISLEDITTYIHMKRVEDYTYDDMLAVLRSKSYDNIPFEFMIFMGRMVEDTAIRLHQFTGIGEYTQEDSIIYIKNYSSYPVRVQYRTEGGIHIQEYRADYVVNDLTVGELKEFTEEYVSRVTTELDKHNKHKQYYLEQLKRTVSWVQTYLTERYTKEGAESYQEWGRNIKVNVRKLLDRKALDAYEGNH